MQETGGKFAVVPGDFLPHAGQMQNASGPVTGAD